MTGSFIGDAFVYGGTFGLVVRLMFAVVLRHWGVGRR